MNRNHTATLMRSLTGAPSRRNILRGLAGAGLGLGAARFPEIGRAKRKSTPKLRRNEFGCVPIGEPCRGSNANCCSGVCQGKKPEKGKKDKSVCVAHDASTCVAGQRDHDICARATNVACTTSTGDTGQCQTTTGTAPYCARQSYCFRCSRDADCRPFCGEKAACIECVGCTVQGGTACSTPTKDSCEFPM